MNTNIPELSDEQIESMRFTIMTDVGKAARTKTRRYRQVVLGAATVIALGGIGATAIGTYSDPSHPSNLSASKADAGGSAGQRDIAGGSPAYSTDLGTTEDSAKAAPDADREIITTGHVSITVGKPTDTAQKIIHYVEGAGGRIDSRDETAPSGDDGGSVILIVRVPQTKVSTSIETFHSYGKVDSVSLADQDVTTQGQDLDARIKALQISVGRLESLMKNSKSTSDLLKAETALSQRQADLDSLVSQRTGLTDQVKLSSLEIDISSKPKATSVSPSGFWGGIVDGWNGLVSAIDGTVHGLGVVIPWGIALALLGGIVWIGRRVTRRSRA